MIPERPNQAIQPTADRPYAQILPSINAPSNLRGGCSCSR